MAQLVNSTQIVREEELIRHLAQGLTVKDASEAMGLSYQTALRYAKRTGFQERLRAYSSKLWESVDEEIRTNRAYDIAKRLEEAAEEALEGMIQLATSGNSESLKFKACQDLLDRDPITARSKPGSSGSNQGQMPMINIAVLQQAARVIKEEETYFRREEELKELPSASEKPQ